MASNGGRSLVWVWILLSGVMALCSTAARADGWGIPIAAGMGASISHSLNAAQSHLNRLDWDKYGNRRLVSGFTNYGPFANPRSMLPAAAKAMRFIGGAAPLAFLMDVSAQMMSGGQVDLVGSVARTAGASILSYGLTTALIAAGVSGGLPLMLAIVGGGIAGSYIADWLLARARSMGRPDSRAPRGRERLTLLDVEGLRRVN